jgi:antirestriction protein ArdC
MSATKTRTARPRRQCSEEERAERRARERERMQAAVEELRSSDGWQAWLTTRSRFHRYSLGNQLLIASQRDGQPTRKVAGFRKWLELGYCVRKGEHALYIYAPCPPSKKDIEEARERGEEPRRTFFKMTPVFADEQVDPLPPPAEPQPLDPPVAELEGDELAPAWESLVRLAESIGSSVKLAQGAEMGDAHGFYEPVTKRIVIAGAFVENAQVKTLVHELAHALVRADRQDDDPTLTYAQEEFVVESIAYSVTGTLGFDTSGYSVGYLTAWSTNTELEILEQTAKLINRLASRIEDAIPGEVLS